MRIRAAFTFDDITLDPSYSEVKSRKDVDLTTEFFGRKIKIPIISSNMSSITDWFMANEILLAGGLGILHRFEKTEKILEWISILRTNGLGPIIPSIGVHERDFENAKRYVEHGVDAICIDVAHGDSKLMVDAIKRIKSLGVRVIAGNVCNYAGALRLIDAGADAIKVGVGNGSACSTRIMTGFGIPQFSALLDCYRLKHRFPHIVFISDGGVKNSGDCVKALIYSDFVMSGYLFSGAEETPGEIVTINGKRYKKYYGEASQLARDRMGGYHDDYMPEGVDRLVDLKPSVSQILPQLAFGIRSGFSYTGASNIKEFKENVRWLRVTNSGQREGLPWGSIK